MQYTTAKPRDLTATETRLLASIQAAGWWSVDARCLSYDDQEALEFLWRTGYIERKAYGGWGAKVTGQAAAAPPAPAVESIAVGKHNLVVMFCDRTWKRHLAGTPEYAQYADMARGMGKGQVLAGRNGVLAYGNIDRLIGKWKGD